MEIKFEQLTAETTGFTLDIEHWEIAEKQSWGVFSTEGDIGSLIADLLTGESCCLRGTISGINVNKIAQVSLSEQQRLLALELANDDTEFMNRIDHGSSVYSLVYQQCEDKALTTRLLEDLDLLDLQNSGFRMLSTGETRRLLLARALATDPEFLVLDEPYVGLDIEHRASLANYLEALSEKIQMLVVVSRETEIPAWVNKVALFSEGKLVSEMNKLAWDSDPVIAQIKAQSTEQSEQMINLIKNHRHSSPFENPIFELKHGRVGYADQTIFSGVNWRINKGEHWQVKGPNGCGKSTLLGLIFGDHPQCYSNDIQIFGKQRGSGETIWDIKKNIGMVSSALHLQYRVNCSALDVILSGFYDSIGLYKKPTAQEVTIAKEWLAILYMSDFARVSFKQLAYGQQRLLLIARAIVKQPSLLIVDEPYQGLDYLGRRLVKNTLELIAKENLSQLLYVSHYKEDSLESIKHYLTFVADPQGNGYQADINSNEN